MATEIRLSDGESIRVVDDYAEVTEKLLAAGWREFCEFHQRQADGETTIMINPGSIVYLRSV